MTILKTDIYFAQFCFHDSSQQFCDEDRKAAFPCGAPDYLQLSPENISDS